jgi:SAM-dependent methyltransferase
MNYDAKPDNYFDGARKDFVQILPANSAGNILEIGCGFGETGSLALSEGKCQSYTGIELSERAAKAAASRLTHVIHGNIEDMELEFKPDSFDAVILSEVLEHLVDPWAALTKIHPFLKRGAIVLASSPNIAHYKVILRLMRGDWTLADSGVMDRTHLRWFTPRTYGALFADTGYLVGSIKPIRPFGWRARAVDGLSGKRLTHLFMNQICIQATKL